MSVSPANPMTGTLRSRRPRSFSPPPVNRIEDTGLSQLWLQDLALKILYFQGYMSGFKMAEMMALPFAGVVNQILEALKREKFVEVVKSSQMGLGEGAYEYAITGAGIARAREALEADPASVYLNRHLADARARKLRVLQQAALMASS